MNTAPTRLITLDRQRVLRFDFNAMARIEDATGGNTLGDFWDSMDARATRAVVWAMLYDDDPTLTLDQVGRLISEHGMGSVMEALLALIGEAFPDAAQEGDVAPLAVS